MRNFDTYARYCDVYQTTLSPGLPDVLSSLSSSVSMQVIIRLLVQ